MWKATYGTGSSVMAPSTLLSVISPHLPQPLPGMMAKILFYGLEGNIPHTGDAVAWMADSTGFK